MNLLTPDIEIAQLPRLGPINFKELWSSIPIEPVPETLPELEAFERCHDEWTEKIRIMWLDGKLLVDCRIVPGLDRLFQHLFSQAGWARLEVYIVSDMGRRGIDSWTALSVVNDRRPVIILGTELVHHLNERELSFSIGHETGHLLCYNSDWRKEMSLGFLIRQLFYADQESRLESMFPGGNWRSLYCKLMANSRQMEMRCDRLGLMLCGDKKSGASALLSVALKNVQLARNIDIGNYLSVHHPLLVTSPAAGPISMNAGHPFIPQRIQALNHFYENGEYQYFAA